MSNKKQAVGTVRLSRFIADGILKHLDVPFASAPRPASNAHGVYYPIISEQYLDGFDVEDSDL